MAQPNAGQPKLVNMKVVYDETPDQMVGGVVPLLDAGANIIGACCGSAPDHIRAFRSGRSTSYLKRSRGPHENETLRHQSGGRSTKLPAKTDDKSGIGVHYVDAYLKPMNTQARGRHRREVQTPGAEDRVHRRRGARVRG